MSSDVKSEVKTRQTNNPNYHNFLIDLKYQLSYSQGMIHNRSIYTTI